MANKIFNAVILILTITCVTVLVLFFKFEYKDKQIPLMAQITQEHEEFVKKTEVLETQIQEIKVSQVKAEAETNKALEKLNRATDLIVKIDEQIKIVSDPTYSPSKTDRGGEVLRGVNSKLSMRATAYDLSIESCGKSRDSKGYGITRSGTRATAGRTVAVDPATIPLGSQLYVVFPAPHEYLTGYYTAEDTGSAVKGDIIDIFLGEDAPGENSVEKQVSRFGMRRVQVYIVDSKAKAREQEKLNSLYMELNETLS